MPRRRLFAIAGLLALGLVKPAHAFFPLFPNCPTPSRPWVPSQPAPNIVMPPMPSTDPSNPTRPVDPTMPNPMVPETPAPQQNPTDTLAGNDFLGGQASYTMTPNMFGDFFGGVGNIRTGLRPNAFVFNGNGSLTFSPVSSKGSEGLTGGPTTAYYFPNGANSSIQLILNGYGSASLGAAPAGLKNDVFQQVNFSGSPPGSSQFAVNQNTTNVFTEVVNRLSQTTQGQLAMLAILNKAVPLPNGTILSSVDSLTLGSRGVLNVRGQNTGDLIYFYQIAARGLQTVPFDLGVTITNPTSGGVVGRSKVSDDNSPFPRDRAIFNYDYYAGTRLTADGFNVSRFSIGAETTFLDRQGSVEFRIPFASTLNSALTLDGITNRDMELGNIVLAGKWQWTRDPILNFASGITVALPTADDTVIRLSRGPELIRVKNEAALLSPYAAVSYTPDDRLFMQSWMSVGFDPFGNTVRYRNLIDNTVQNARIYDLPIFSVDGQVGYWLARNTDPGALIQGLAPFLELHYNKAINFGRVSATFNGVRVVEARTGFDDINMTVGLTTQIRNNLMITNGLVVPLGEKENRFFDWQYGLRVNWLYGPTAQANEAAMARLRNGNGANNGTGVPIVPNTFSQKDSSTGDLVNVQHTEVVPTTPSPMEQTLLANNSSTCSTCATNYNYPDTPPFFGDFMSVGGQRTVLTPTGPQRIHIPIIPHYAGLKVTDNDGPRPADRFYFAYNGITGAYHKQNPGGFQDLDVNREIIGFEKTIFDGKGSFGMRLPFVQQGGPSLEDSAIGDLTLVTKYAWCRDDATGSIVSSGVNLTLPTGHSGTVAQLNDGGLAPSAIWLQPWTGFLVNHDRLYTQGVVSLAASSQAEYPTELFSSVAVGYWLVKSDSDGIRGLIPTVELHGYMPLTNRGNGRLVDAFDGVNMTTGLNVLLPKLTLGGAVSFPVLGQSTHRIEALATVNFRF